MTTQTASSPPAAIYKVKTLSGHYVELKSKSEAQFYKSAQEKYMHDFSFTVASDLRALDRLVFLETLIFRYQTLIGSGFDYEGEEISTYDLSDMRKALKESSTMAADVQRDLGLTVAQREKDKYDSVGNYVDRLKQAAKQFGVYREKQLGVALEILNEIFAESGAYLRSNDNERRKLGRPTAESVLQHIDGPLREQYLEVDRHFRANQQKFWIGQL